MRYTYTSIVAMFVLAGTVHAQPVQWTVAEGGNGHWYEYNPTPTDWHSARSYASQQGGDLASISSVEENVFIHNLVPHAAWIGATDEAEEGDWHWSNGDTWDYTNWGSGEPNNNDPTYGEDYAYMVGYDHPNGTDFWYDGSIITADIASVIEWDHDPSIKQWRIEDGGNGHWYQGVRIGYYPDSPGASWGWCKEQAELAGGYLATITSYEEDEWVKSTIIVPMEPPNLEAGPQIGGQLVDGQWRWITGESWDYEGWGGAEPNGDGDRLEYWRWGSLWWNDRPDSWDPSINTYIVEYTVLPGSALGACCLDGLCITTASADCEGHGGTWGGADSSCVDFSCPISCPGDTDGNGVVDIEDILTVVGAWGPCP